MTTAEHQPATFAELGASDEIVAALADKGISTAFPIQELAIPIALTGADMIGQARTGTGKTFAYGIPVLQHVIVPGSEEFEDYEHYGKPQAVILAPTRELAIQVASDLETAGAKSQARVVCIYGGVSYDEQLASLKDGVEVVVGTPGRVLDLAQQKALDLRFVSQFVLDEADEMLDLGFLPDVERVSRLIPESRQTLLFSATMPAPIVALAREQLHQPVHVRAEGDDAQATVPETTQFIYRAHELDKPEIIAKLMQAEGSEKIIIFTRTKRSAQRLSDELEDRGFSVASIHGDLNQTQRERTLKKFRAGQLKALVATDVAARGIDVTGISHVVNYEVPDDPKQYVHRIGRTGRAGSKGVAVTLVDWQDVTRWNVINKALDLDRADPPEAYSTTPELLADLQIPEGTKGRLPGAQPKERKPREDKGGRGRGGKRDSHRDGKRRDDKSHEHHHKDDVKSKSDEHAKDETKKDPSKPKRRRRRTHHGAAEQTKPAED